MRIGSSEVEWPSYGRPLPVETYCTVTTSEAIVSFEEALETLEIVMNVLRNVIETLRTPPQKKRKEKKNHSSQL